MTWLLPSALTIAGIAAALAVALHFIARSRPLAEPLPTARFIPRRPVRARTRSFALSDLALLLLRLAAVLVLGAAVAGPMFAAAHERTARVVVVDRSRIVADGQAARDSARALLRAGDVLIAFDSAAVVAHSLDSIAPTSARGSLSAALAAATRSAVSLASQADSVELVMISPLGVEEADEATTRIRATWPGRLRVVRMPIVSAGVAAPHVETDASESDAVVAGLALMGKSRSLASLGTTRLVRGRVTAADSAWARDGHVLIHWPSADSGAVVWRRRETIDAIGGVASSTGTLVARFPRLWVMEGTAVARWSDGEPAAVEYALGNGCVRDVGILLDPSSDITLRAPFRRFVAGLLTPCGGARSTAAMDSATAATFAGAGPLAAAPALRDRGAESSRWTPWLLVAGALLLLLELGLRRSERRLA